MCLSVYRLLIDRAKMGIASAQVGEIVMSGEKIGIRELKENMNGEGGKLKEGFFSYRGELFPLFVFSANYRISAFTL